MQGEYRGDCTRDTFDPTKRFLRVLHQQGRVQLDADYNEQVSILLHYLQSMAKDLFGQHGGPCDNSFLITPTPTHSADFKIGHGHYYVDGILCEAADTTYRGQPDPPFADNERLMEGTNLVYLDVWERHITHIEDDFIREVALGGTDTATRAKVVWQVKATSDGPLNSPVPAGAPMDDWKQWVDDNWDTWRAKLQPANRGLLRAKAKEASEQETDPCITSPESRYRGAENRLYRVEIHTGGQINNGGPKPTFKWSRDNSSVAAAWVGTNGDKLTGVGIRDIKRGFAAGQWIELIHDELEFRGEPGIMVKLIKVEGEILTVDPATATQPIPSDPSFLKHPKVRRWDHSTEQKAHGAGQAKVAKPDRGALLIEEKQWLTLEDGVQIYFEKDPDHQYRTGDYWLIPARTATGDVEWPGPPGKPDAAPPHGIEHHYAPLAIISVDGGKVTLPDGADLRSRKRLDGCPP